MAVPTNGGAARLRQAARNALVWVGRRPIGQRVLDLYERRGLLHTVGPGRTTLTLDYPVDPQPRFGHGRPAHPELHALLARGDRRYRGLLQAILANTADLITIPVRHAHSSTEPSWDNGWLPGLDAATLYTLVAREKPRLYLEVGSGNSTKFARRAVRDRHLGTRIVSIDPSPRAEIDELCDEVIRFPLEAVDLSIFDGARSGDIVFLDSSHQVFTNSDVTVFFLEVLPRLSPGVLVQLHDIFLPDDYLPGWNDRFYSEQYLLAAWLLGGSHGLETVMPAWYVSHHPELRRVLDGLWSRPELQGVERHGASYWMRTS